MIMKKSEILLSMLSGKEIVIEDGNFNFFISENLLIEKEEYNKNKSLGNFNIFKNSMSYFPQETIKALYMRK